MNEKRRCAFAVCGSFCTLETALEQAFCIFASSTDEHGYGDLI